MDHTSILYHPYTLASPDALDNSFIMDGAHSYQAEKTYVIEVISGSFTFCVGQVVQPNSTTYTAGAKIVLTALAKTKIFYKASAGGDQMSITF